MQACHASKPEAVRSLAGRHKSKRHGGSAVGKACEVQQAEKNVCVCARLHEMGKRGSERRDEFLLLPSSPGEKPILEAKFINQI